MATSKKKDSLEQKLEELTQRSAVAIEGTDDSLSADSAKLADVIRGTIIDSSKKYSKRSNDGVVDFFSSVSLNKNLKDTKKDEAPLSSKKDIKEYMETANIDIGSLLMSEQDRLMNYKNYEAIYQIITEAATGLDVYKDNIMSPDDFTKLVFRLKYEDETDEDMRETVESQLEDVQEKYNLVDISDRIVHDTLLRGDEFVAILSLNDEIEKILSDPIMGSGMLNESNIQLTDPSIVDVLLTESDIEITAKDVEAFSEYIKIPDGGLVLTENYGRWNNLERKIHVDTLNEDMIKKIVLEATNGNVVIGTKKELLLERIGYETHSREELNKLANATWEKGSASSSKKKKKKDNKPIALNGSSIKILDPERTVELKIDNICYGYLYAEEKTAGTPSSSYLGMASGRELGTDPGIANQTASATGATATNYTSAIKAANIFDVSDEKLRIISQIFVNTISKKIDKDFIRHNRDMKDFIYGLLKQDYILKKELKLIFFTPEEVIHFEAPPVFRKITFFAKLYLSVLVNDLLIKMGRSHDKRVFYVDIGIGNDYEQAISKLIEDVKTKEIKMDDLGDLNTILSLHPGRFDDYYIPTVNGERPVDIETIAGMDATQDSEFLEFLKNSMLNGIGIPANLVDAMREVDFARTLATQNANFVRSVIKYQRKLTKPFSKMYQRLYVNEFKYSGDKESNIEDIVRIDRIKAHFPSPATLNQTNMTEQISAADANADAIATSLIPPKQDGSTEDYRIKLKSKIMMDLLPGIDWEKYQEISDRIAIEDVRGNIGAADQQDPGAQDPYGNQFY